MYFFLLANFLFHVSFLAFFALFFKTSFEQENAWIVYQGEIEEWQKAERKKQE
jgi:hypothetical protein